MSIDPAFGINNFGKQKMYSESETLANNILTVLLGKPGSFPSIPSLGMYVQGVVIQPYDQIDTDSLKNELVTQCAQFKGVVQGGEFDVMKTTTKNKDGDTIPVILFIIPTQIKGVGNRLAIGISTDSGATRFNFSWL